MDQVPSQIDLPVWERHVGEVLVHLLKELGDRRLIDARGSEISVPGKSRRERAQLGKIHLVIRLVRITPFDASHRSLGKLGFDPHDRSSFVGSLCGVIACELEHFRDVFDILLPQLLRSVVALRVVVAVGQT